MVASLIQCGSNIECWIFFAVENTTIFIIMNLPTHKRYENAIIPNAITYITSTCYAHFKYYIDFFIVCPHNFVMKSTWFDCLFSLSSIYLSFKILYVEVFILFLQTFPRIYTKSSIRRALFQTI